VKGDDDYEKVTQRNSAEHSLHEGRLGYLSGNHGSELWNQGRFIGEGQSCSERATKKMKRVFRAFGYVDANGVIQMKGRTACEINTTQELVAVELMFRA